MKRTVAFIIGLLLLPFAISCCSSYLIPAGPRGTVTARSFESVPSSRTFTIVVSSTGFNGTSTSMNVTVNQGDTVTINFVYGDGALSFDNPHQVKIEGYGLTTGTIDRSSLTQTLSFKVNQAGQFQIHCVQPCFGMTNLQQGVLLVKQACLGSTLIPTGLSPLLFDLRSSRAVAVSTTLANMTNTPVSGVIVDFYVNTDFGQMVIGHNTTTRDGLAELTYTPGTTNTLYVTVTFGGTCVYGMSTVGAIFQLPPSGFQPNGQSPFINGQTQVDPRLVGVVPILAMTIVGLGAIVVGSVWATIAYVGVSTLRLRRGRRSREEEKE